MKYTVIAFLCFFIFKNSYCQYINCEVYKKDSVYYKACVLYEKAVKYPQGSRLSQIALDEVIKECPSFAPAYYAKAVPYLKRGFFIKWKELIDQAVEYNPVEYLGYRGGARYMFLRDYEGGVADIERYIEICPYDIGFVYNGDYHLKEILALSYRGIGDNDKAIEILETCIRDTMYFTGIYKYLHLGVLYMEEKMYSKAINNLGKQIEENDNLAESYFYLAKIYAEQGKPKLRDKNLTIAKKYFKQGKVLPGSTFMDYQDKIYIQDFECFK